MKHSISYDRNDQHPFVVKAQHGRLMLQGTEVSSIMDFDNSQVTIAVEFNETIEAMLLNAFNAGRSSIRWQLGRELRSMSKKSATRRSHLLD